MITEKIRPKSPGITKIKQLTAVNIHFDPGQRSAGALLNRKTNASNLLEQPDRCFVFKLSWGWYPR